MPKGTESGRFSVAYLLTPFIAIVVATPAIVELSPFGRNAPPWWLSNLPFWMGLASSPGYVYAWSMRWHGRPISPTKRVWVEFSLAVALIASFWGTLLMLLTFIYWVFPGISTWMCFQLLVRFRRARREREMRMNPTEQSRGPEAPPSR